MTDAQNATIYMFLKIVAYATDMSKTGLSYNLKY